MPPLDRGVGGIPSDGAADDNSMPPFLRGVGGISSKPSLDPLSVEGISSTIASCFLIPVWLDKLLVDRRCDFEEFALRLWWMMLSISSKVRGAVWLGNLLALAGSLGADLITRARLRNKPKVVEQIAAIAKFTSSGENSDFPNFL